MLIHPSSRPISTAAATALPPAAGRAPPGPVTVDALMPTPAARRPAAGIPLLCRRRFRPRAAWPGDRARQQGARMPAPRHRRRAAADTAQCRHSGRRCCPQPARACRRRRAAAAPPPMPAARRPVPGPALTPPPVPIPALRAAAVSASAPPPAPIPSPRPAPTQCARRPDRCAVAADKRFESAAVLLKEQHRLAKWRSVSLR